MKGITYENIVEFEQLILIKIHVGNFTVDQIINSWKLAIINGDLKKGTIGTVLDFTNAHLKMNLKSDIEKLIAYLNSEPSYFRNFKFAVIMHEPSQVTIPFIVERSEHNFKTKTFHSFHAGKNWILK